MMKSLCRRHFPYSMPMALILIEVILTTALATPASTQEKFSQVSLSTAVAQVAKQNIPAVVHIEITQREKVVNPFLPFENDLFFRYFFGDLRVPRKFERELNGRGTGIIMDSLGHILTNYHVVGGATQIQVLLFNGKQYPAMLVGTEPKTDLGVIQISAEESPPYVKFGDSDQVQVGEWVVAIGHPRCLDQTITQGIISAKHRRGIMVPSSYQDFLQTDAAISPGNSGGPLLNLQGEVIGVNAAIVPQSGGFEGIGFAIPSNMAVYVAEQLIAHGRVEHGWLGGSVQDLTPGLASSFDLENPKGALISDIVKGGPADKADIKRGDVVISYCGKEISDASTLHNEVAVTPVGKIVDLTLLRRGKKREALVKIGSAGDAIKMGGSSIRARLGAEFRPVTPREIKKFDLNSNQGVAIIWLDPKGPLTNVGFELNDLILGINGQAIEGLEAFVDLLSTLRQQQRVVLLALDHQSGRTGYVQVTVQ